MSDSDLEILAVTLMDIRATIESMRRSVTGAQSSIEQFRHTNAQDRLDDIADCLRQLATESATIAESVTAGDHALKALRDRPTASSASSS